MRSSSFAFTVQGPSDANGQPTSTTYTINYEIGFVRELGANGLWEISNSFNPADNFNDLLGLCVLSPTNAAALAAQLRAESTSEKGQFLIDNPGIPEPERVAFNAFWSSANIEASATKHVSDSASVCIAERDAGQDLSLLNIASSSGTGGREVTAVLDDGSYTRVSGADDLFTDAVSVTTTEVDVTNTQPWDTHTTETNAVGRVVLDNYDFAQTVRDYVNGSHDLGLLHLAQLDAAMVDQLMIQIEREALDGGGAGDHVPMPSAYNWDVFNSGYAVFNAGAYNIDFGAFDNNPVTANTSVSLVDVPQTNGIDVSGYAGGIDAWELSGTLTGSPQSFEFSIDFGIFFPLVLDLDGDGVDVLPRLDSTVYFNLDGDAFLEQTAWMGAGDGMLVLDRPAAGGNGPGDGLITQIDELSYSTQPGQTDLEGLRAYDTNYDNQLTAADTDWSRFRIWVDANRDGITNAGELRTLAQWNITSYSLVRDTQQFNLADNSTVFGYSTFVMGGVVRQAADLGLSYNTDGFTNFHGINGVANEAYRTFIGEDGSSLAIYNSYSSSGNQAFTLGLPGNIQGVRSGAYNDTIVVTAGYTGDTWTFGDSGNDTIQGGGGPDVMDGGEGVNTMNGNAGDDTIYFKTWDIVNGGAGYDTAILTHGNALSMDLTAKGLESVIASSGADTISAGAATVGTTIDGRAGNDVITGAAYGDVLIGGLGNDTVNAGGGDDLVTGGDGNDYVSGESGNDNIMGGDGVDYVYGGLGNDILDGGAGNDGLYGGAGNDEFVIDSVADYIVENVSEGIDTIRTSLTYYTIGANVENLAYTGTAAFVGLGSVIANSISGGGANDALYAYGGNDTVYGGGGHDTIAGDAGNDSLFGGDGSDTLSELFDSVGSGNDYFDGGNGVDLMYAAAGNDSVYGGTDTANNYADLGLGDDAYFGSAGTDTVLGRSGNNSLTGNAGADSLYGEDGNDSIYGGAGIDVLSGAAGNDSLDGGADNDQLVGDAGTDILLGGGGVDILYGGADADTLNGGTGGNVDALYGGAGNDVFQAGGTGYDYDYIYDFVGGAGASDVIALQTGAAITLQYASSGNYYIDLSNGSHVIVVGVTSVLAEDIVLGGF